MSAGGIGSGLSLRIERMVRMISNRSAFIVNLSDVVHPSRVRMN